MPTYKRFEIEQHGEITELRLNDRTLSDLVVETQLSDELGEFICNESPQKLVVSFINVGFCGSGTIGTIIVMRKKVVAYGGSVALCSLTEPILTAFHSLNLVGTLFTIHDSIEESIESFET